MTTASAAVVGAMYIAGEAVVGDAGAFHGVDPADGSALEPGFQFADGKLVARAAELAESAFEPFRAAPIEQRARLLDYRHVLERGLMAGRFLRWFEDGHSSV